MNIVKKKNRAIEDLQAVESSPFLIQQANPTVNDTQDSYVRAKYAGANCVDTSCACADYSQDAYKNSSNASTNNANNNYADTSHAKTDTPYQKGDKPTQENSLEKKILRNARITACAVVIALVGIGFGVWSLYTTQKQINTLSSDCIPTLVCTSDLTAGDKISASSVSVQQIPSKLRSTDALSEEALSNDTVIGRTILVNLSAGTQLRQAYFAGSGSTNSLASAIKPGKEAISISVDKETGLASLLRVGDIVRVTQTETGVSGSALSITITDDARVIALDNSLQGSENYSTVTLEVSAEQADAIRQARLSGSVSLTMAGQSENNSVSPLSTSNANSANTPAEHNEGDIQ